MQKARYCFIFSGIIALILIIFLLASCSTGADSDDNDSGSTSSGYSTGGSTSADLSGVTTDGDVSSFTIAFDNSGLSESSEADAEDEDLIANSSFDDTISVVFSASGSATVSGDDKGYATVSGNKVTVNNTGSEKIFYTLSGTSTNGCFKLYSEKKQAIELKELNLTNPEGPAINNQSGKRTFIVLADGTSNYLTDGTTYASAPNDEDQKAALFSEGQFIFSGTGYLQVDANCKAGIRSDDYVRTLPGCHIYVDASAGNGIRGNESVTISGGVLNINVTGTADKGISSDGLVEVDGGRTTVITSGGYEWDADDNDYSACAEVKADSLFRITGGKLFLKSTGIGGKGISSDGMGLFEGGTVKIITSGTSYPSNTNNSTYSTSPKGIKCDGDISITGGLIQVRDSHSEGIESKQAMTITGGTVECYCYDDAINSKYNLTITGGYIYAHSSGNDGIDANRNLYINGGVVIAEGTSGAECGLDAAEGYSYYQNGGTVVAIGGNVQATASSSSQASVSTTASLNTTYALANSTTNILTYKTPSSGGSALMISSPSLSSGSNYTLFSGVSISGGTAFHGLTLGAATSGGSTFATLTAATQIGSTQGGGGGHGGRF